VVTTGQGVVAAVVRGCAPVRLLRLRWGLLESCLGLWRETTTLTVVLRFLWGRLWRRLRTLAWVLLTAFTSSVTRCRLAFSTDAEGGEGTGEGHVRLTQKPRGPLMVVDRGARKAGKAEQGKCLAWRRSVSGHLSEGSKRRRRKQPIRFCS
jgi:hypothetical protein